MTGEEKLFKMLNRGWAITLSRQPCIGTWDVVGAIDFWSLKKGQGWQHIGQSRTLLEALERIEPELARMQIQRYAEMLRDEDCTDEGRKLIAQKISEMTSLLE